MAKHIDDTELRISLDGRSAEEQLKKLQKESAQLRLSLKRAFDANDAGEVARLERELSKNAQTMRRLNKETVNVDAILKNLSGGKYKVT